MPKSFLSLILISLIPFAGCRRNAGIPEPGSKHYRDLVSAFYVGLAGLQAGEDVRAKQGLTLASQIAPGEPASWANLGLLELRQQQYEQALQDAEKADKLAPGNSRIQALLGLIESKRGNLKEAVGHFRNAVASNPQDVKALYALAGETERQGSPESDAESRRLLLQILHLQPNNQAVLLDVIRLSAKLGDAAAVTQQMSTLQKLTSSWPEVAKHQLNTVTATAAGNIRAAAVQVQFLRNLLVRDISFRQDQDAIRPPANTLGEPFVRFIRIAPLSSEPAPSDTNLQFAPKQTASPANGMNVTWAGAIVLDARADPRVFWADRSTLHLDQGSNLGLPGAAGSALTRNSIATGDLNYDFKTDIVIATAGGLRIYQQGVSPLFTDVTGKTRLDPQIINGAFTGAWLFDIDLDGDLDIVLGTIQGPPVVLRNNGDGSYTTIRPFPAGNGMKDFATADIDGDGDPDVAIIDRNGNLSIFGNERLGNYRLRPPAVGAGLQLAAIKSGDIDGDGLMDFVALASDGRVLRISDTRSGQAWDTSELLRTDGANRSAGSLVIADLDNNGSLDLIIGKQVLLHDSKGFTSLTKHLDGECQAVLDSSSTGRPDLLVLVKSADDSSSLLQLVNRGTKAYKWQTIRTRAAQTAGDQRINSYGVGGEVEVRSGLLTQKQSIVSPVLHFGLGDNAEVSLARIVWPNGQLQVEFDLKPDATALAQQRLKGSCPFLFAWDGKRMRFIKDCAPWSPALGLHVNAQKVAGIYQTQEWFKIPGEQIQPRDGFYDLRITAEYWETFYIDHYSFLAVDHPNGTEVFTDERFAVPPPSLRLYGTGATQPFASARDDRNNDVHDIVATMDGRYLDTFGRGRYQGVTRDHWVELELPASAPKSGPLYLIGSGWLHPTDATINVALGQSSDPSPQGLSIEVLTANGKWKLKRAGLGFPAGRIKDVVLNLSGLFAPTGPRRLRLRTNLEIYWDRLAWASGIADDQLKVQRLQLAGATLGYRGFSRMTQANSSSPELPDYASVVERGPRWHDLEGYYTRYGDVRPLLEKIDNRMLITNAGDELSLRVPVPATLPKGWRRDLIMIGDGWIKDGDFNSVFSRTVLPLPYHGLKEYTVNSQSLEEDPAYKLHPEDWKAFHTRYVSPELFTRALWH